MIEADDLTRPHTWLDALVYFTMQQIVSFDQCASRKATAKIVLRRHYSLSVVMIEECHRWGAMNKDLATLRQRLDAAENMCYMTHGIRNLVEPRT